MKALREAKVKVAEMPEEIPQLVKEALKKG